MASTKPVHLRLTPPQIRMLRQLCAKLGLDRTNVIRLAIARLAESEGLLKMGKIEEDH